MIYPKNHNSSPRKIISNSLIRGSEDISDFGIVFETLNQIGNERGIDFKKGTQKQSRQNFSLKERLTLRINLAYDGLLWFSKSLHNKSLASSSSDNLHFLFQPDIVDELLSWQRFEYYSKFDP